MRLLPRFNFFLSSTLALTVTLFANVALAGDPFPRTNPRDIGDNTEAAFNSLFQEGNYQQAKEYLIQAETEQEQEPLAYALRSSIAYTEEDWETMKIYADKTLLAAEILQSRDPVRGNLYLAVGHFLQGSHTYLTTKDAVSALSKLPLVFQYLDEAEKSDSSDPELNLLIGYMDLLLAVNLPFSNPDDAITKFKNSGRPTYLVYRGIAIAYRDLNRNEKALEFVNLALEATPDNPELFYLKAQILRRLGKESEDVSLLTSALEYFNLALEKQAQLPDFIINSLSRERDGTTRDIEKFSPNN